MPLAACRTALKLRLRVSFAREGTHINGTYVGTCEYFFVYDESQAHP